MSFIVDEPYTINQKFGIKDYQISVDSPGFNEPINWFWAKCKPHDHKKIAILQAKAKDIQFRGRIKEAEKWEHL